MYAAILLMVLFCLWCWESLLEGVFDPGNSYRRYQLKFLGYRQKTSDESFPPREGVPHKWTDALCIVQLSSYVHSIYTVCTYGHSGWDM